MSNRRRCALSPSPRSPSRAVDSAAESVAECCACCVQPLIWKRSPAKELKARSGERGSRSWKRQTCAEARTAGSTSARATQKARKSVGRHLT